MTGATCAAGDTDDPMIGAAVGNAAVIDPTVPIELTATPLGKAGVFAGSEAAEMLPVPAVLPATAFVSGAAAFEGDGVNCLSFMALCAAAYATATRGRAAIARAADGNLAGGNGDRSGFGGGSLINYVYGKPLKKDGYKE